MGTRPPLVDEGAGMFVVAAGVEFAETTPDVDVHAGTSTSSHAEARILQNDVEPASAPPLEEVQVAGLEEVQVAGFWPKPLAKGADRHAEPGPGRNPEAQDKQADAIVPHIQYSELAVESDAMAVGSFKDVYKALWLGKNRTVALLVLRNTYQAALEDMEQ